MLLQQAGGELFSSPTCLYDFGDITNPKIRLRAIGAVDLLYTRAQLVAGAPQVLVAGTATRTPQVVRLFDGRSSFLKGTVNRFTAIPDASGSSWASSEDGSVNDPKHRSRSESISVSS